MINAGANFLTAVKIALGFAHMPNLVELKSIDSTSNLPELIAAVTKIVAWFNKQYTIARQEYNFLLIPDVFTCWNFTFDTSALENLSVKQKIHLNQVLTYHDL